MDSLLSFLVDYKVADVAIGLVGIFGLLIVIDRFKALYMDYAMPAEDFMKQVMKLVESDKIEEAITFCSANERKPLAFVVKKVLQHSDRDERSIEDALNTAASEVAPKLVRRLGYLSMISNVVTLMGLFGTVIGLIVAFKALSFADVSQKQTILAQGISIAMTATAMGLMVAIPIMFLYSFLYEKQSRLFSEIDLHSHKMVQFLRERDFVPFTHDAAYPNTLHSDKLAKPPGPKTKVS